MNIVKTESGRILRVEKDGEVKWDREQERQRIKKKARAETLEDLYEMGQLDQATIDQIQETQPEVYQMAKNIVVNR